MGESQSRYSIVERLTKTKLDIMSGKGRLKEQMQVREQELARAKKDKVNWEVDYEQETNRKDREYDRVIEEAKTELKNAEDLQKEKEEALDEKLKAVNDALDKIEKISEISQSPN